jgi:hypothetical protein
MTILDSDQISDLRSSGGGAAAEAFTDIDDRATMVPHSGA